MFTNHIYLIYMYKQGLASNNLQWLIWCKSKPNKKLKVIRHNLVYCIPRNSELFRNDLLFAKMSALTEYTISSELTCLACFNIL